MATSAIFGLSRFPIPTDFLSWGVLRAVLFGIVPEGGAIWCQREGCNLRGMSFAWAFVVLAFSAEAQARPALPGERVCLFETRLSVSGVLLVPVDQPLGDGEPPAAGMPEREPASVRVVEQPVRAEANLCFLEQRQAASGGQVEAENPILRHYRKAEANLSVGEGEFTTRLPADSGPVRVQLAGKTVQAWLANGFLTQAEHDLLTTPFDPLFLSALVPQFDVGEGDQWAIDAAAVTGLLCIDTVADGQMLVTVERVTETGTTLSLMASIVGAVDGVSTEIELSGSYQLACAGAAPASVTQLEVVMRESRQPGPVGPGLAVEAALRMACRLPAGEAEPAAAASERPHEEASRPADQALARADRPRRGPGQPGCLWLADTYGRFDLIYPNRWKLIEQGAEEVVLRLVDLGALIGQVTIRPLPPNGSPLSLEILQQDIERSLAGQFSHLLAAAESHRSDGTKILRVASAGEADGLPFRWIHYHLSGPNGQRASISFMVETKHEERFGVADQRLVEGLSMSAIE